MGDPRPCINWIHLEDVARMFTMALWNQQMRGPYNAAAPSPVTNADFARGIARALGRPALMRYPLPVLKIIIGEAGEYASGGPRVEVAKIQDAGYRFFFSDLDQALAHELAS
jgi:NAD dependent epimerase/dehydratase family enzyme